jgi:hypothetical protein
VDPGFPSENAISQKRVFEGIDCSNSGARCGFYISLSTFAAAEWWNTALITTIFDAFNAC